MTTSTIVGEVQSYLTAVATHLADLPEAEREELIDDLREHLKEVAAEGEGSLSDRLGPPSEYAEEFRASAGLPVSSSEPPSFFRRAAAGMVASGPGRLVRKAIDSRAGRSLIEFLPQLRPGWWVLRGYLAVLMLDVLTGYHYYGDVDDLLVPHLNGSQVWALIAIGLGIAASVALGRRSGTPPIRRLSLLVNGVAVVLGIVAFSRLGQPYYFMPQYYESGSESAPYLHHADGEPITNICPYGSDGKPLAGVLLFDQSGRAIENPAESVYARVVPQIPPLAMIRNAFPRPQELLDPNTGQVMTFTCPRVLLPGTQPVTPDTGITPTPIPT